MIRFYPEPSEGHPVGRNIVYKCEKCGTVLPSILETDYLECACGNLSLDKSAGRFGVDDPSYLSYYRTDAVDLPTKSKSFLARLFSRATQ